jgi:hypothetical protein
MPDFSTSDLNSKSSAGHVDVEKQLTHESAAVPLTAPKTLGAGVSNADQTKHRLAKMCRQHFQSAFSRQL